MQDKKEDIKENIVQETKYALVTGAAGGLAAAAIKELRALDFTVFALDINKDVSKIYKDDTKIVPIICDVTGKESVASAFSEIDKLTDRLDLVANFAGIIMIGSLVERSTQEFEKILNVNVVGMYRINKAAFPYLLKTKGRIINISSECGVFDAVPFNTFYTITKHAVEIYSDGLRREIGPLGVQVVKIRPGAFRTNMQGGVRGQFNQVVEKSEYFKDILTSMSGMMDKEIDSAKDPALFAKVFIKAATDKKPKLAYSINHSKSMWLISSLPDGLQDKVYKSYLK
ncbi:MAG: SDR family NAD(P)-dependent oxidoreductase [Christensenellaceae bacterium]|jgi:NAD(P)-dependent dehydrogenase (short-subunit alcohol dehydrogenase family)|nr:SDR family NAD(P)-dependent oxidoreductase [Christensenellaceae bacterium]